MVSSQIVVKSLFGLDNVIPALLFKFAHVARAWAGAMVCFFGPTAVSSFNINGAINVILIVLPVKHSQKIVRDLVFNLSRLLERGREELILILLHH